MRIGRTLAALTLLIAEVAIFVVLPSGIASADAQVASISAAGDSTCAVTTSGGVKCWGYNGDGELGNGSTASSTVPVQVTGLTSGVEAIAAGGRHACAFVDGAVECWGYNGDGEFGNNSTASSLVPVPANPL